MMKRSFLLGRLGIQERSGLKELVEVNSVLLEAKSWGGQSSSVDVCDPALWLGKRDFVAYGV